MSKKQKLRKATKSIFNRFFGFENGVDITNEVAVLHRRNIVIKNITFISNLFYSIVLFIVAYNSEKQIDWLFPAIFVPFTFFLNGVIKRLIFTDRHDKTKQEIGMYVMALYSFITVILFYARFFDNPHLETATYILIYYSLIVISLYQSKSLILWSSFGLFGAMTVIHFTWTYRITERFRDLDFLEFLQAFVKDDSFNDLVLRSLVFILFVVVVYAIVSIGHYMQEQRRIELMKRREIQDDYTNIVSELLTVVLASKGSFLDFQHVTLVQKMSNHLATIYGLHESEAEKLDYYSTIHLKAQDIGDLINPSTIDEIEFDVLKDKTNLAIEIAKRLQLSQKAEDIARAHIDGAATENFVKEMQNIQPDLNAQIILMVDLYITMRGPKRYKRAYPSQMVKNLFTKEFSRYFHFQLLDRFLRFESDFSKMFEEYY